MEEDWRGSGNFGCLRACGKMQGFFGQGFFLDKDVDVAAVAAVVHGVEVSNPSSFLEIPTLYIFLKIHLGHRRGTSC